MSCKNVIACISFLFPPCSLQTHLLLVPTVLVFSRYFKENAIFFRARHRTINILIIFFLSLQFFSPFLVMVLQVNQSWRLHGQIALLFFLIFRNVLLLLSAWGLESGTSPDFSNYLVLVSYSREHQNSDFFFSFLGHSLCHFVSHPVKSLCI